MNPKITIVLSTDEAGQVTMVLEVSDDKSMGDLPVALQMMAMRMLNATGHLRQIIDAAT